jgi:hypothetical protein
MQRTLREVTAASGHVRHVAAMVNKRDLDASQPNPLYHILGDSLCNEHVRNGGDLPRSLLKRLHQKQSDSFAQASAGS